MSTDVTHKKLSMSVKTILFVNIAMVILAAAFSAILIANYVNRVQKDTTRLYQMSSDAYISGIHDRLKNYVTAMEIISMNKDIRENIFRTDVSPQDMVEISRSLGKTIDDITFYLYQNEEIHSHHMYTYLPGDGGYFWDLELALSEPWFADAHKNTSAYGYSYSNVTHTNLLWLIHKINNFGTPQDALLPDSNQICYDTIIVNLEKLFFRHPDIFRNFKAEVVAMDTLTKEVLYSTNSQQNASAVSSIAEDGTLKRTAFSQDGVDLAPIIQHIENPDITILTLFYPSPLVIQGRYLELIAVSLSAAMLLTLMIFLLVFYINYTKRLNFIICKMTRFDEQKAVTHQVMQGRDELSRIDRHLQQMQERIRLLIEDEYVTKMQKMNAQHEALIACINPHFLYNTLNSISAMACMEGADRSVDMIISLSDMFKYSSNVSEKYVSLKDELKNISDYLYIQSVRYENSLKSEINIPPELFSCKVPKLILQPIVENAFKHGFPDKSQKKDGVPWKKLLITATCKDNDLIISILDNGIGMKPAERRALQDTLKTPDGAIASPSSKIGLYNVHQRIRMLYGDQYGLCIESKEQGFMKVSIHLPFSL